MKVNIKIKRDDDIKFRILRWIWSSKYQRWLLRTRRKKKRKEEAEKGWGTGAGIQSWRRSTAPASTRASQVAGQRHPPRPAPHARPTLTCPANVGQRRPSPTRSAHRQWMAFRRDWRASDPRGNGSFFLNGERKTNEGIEKVLMKAERSSRADAALPADYRTTTNKPSSDIHRVYLAARHKKLPTFNFRL